MPADRIDTIVSLAKRRGFVYPSSEIYGGQRAAWDYGPLGVELKDNIKRQWWRSMVQGRDDIVGLDSVDHPGPRGLGGLRPRAGVRRPADRVPVLPQAVPGRPPHRGVRGEARPPAGERPGRRRLPQLRHPRRVHRAADVQRPAVHPPRRDRRTSRAWPTCGRRPRRASSSTSSTCCSPAGRSRRSASARSASRSATRSPRATSSSAPASSSRWRWSSSSSPAPTRSGTTTGSPSATRWYTDLGIDPDNLRHYEHPKEKLSHYSKRTVDIEYRFRFAGSEWGELEGIANRTDFDLTTHSKHSGADLSYFDQEKGERWVPYVIEPAAGVGRPMMAFLVDAYAEDEAPNAKGTLEKRTVLRLDRRLAPVKAAVLPLSRNADLSPKARDLAAELRQSLERRLRRRRRDRPPLPAAGRDRHAVLPDGRLRHARPTTR